MYEARAPLIAMCLVITCVQMAGNIWGIVVRDFFDFIECFTTTFLRAHSWLNWVDEDDDEDEFGLKEKFSFIHSKAGRH